MTQYPYPHRCHWSFQRWRVAVQAGLTRAEHLDGAGRTTIAPQVRRFTHRSTFPQVGIKVRLEY
ncbi:hypothetical protein [Streptomyces yerevanensis]|uniref:hypothetical protein n=1 Tax=Streptomyces yerevanensis TaxID=66378 RepID=UPI0005270274|nr:hypothetical protein [Streptomyces yerevanensis]